MEFSWQEYWNGLPFPPPWRNSQYNLFNQSAVDRHVNGFQPFGITMLQLMQLCKRTISCLSLSCLSFLFVVDAVRFLHLYLISYRKETTKDYDGLNFSRARGI